MPVGAIAIFECIAQGEDAYWEINGQEVSDDDPVYDPATSTYNITMDITALPQNNNSYNLRGIRTQIAATPVSQQNSP